MREQWTQPNDTQRPRSGQHRVLSGIGQGICVATGACIVLILILFILTASLSLLMLIL